MVPPDDLRAMIRFKLLLRVFVSLWSLCIFVPKISGAAEEPGPSETSAADPGLISNARQLIFDGRRSGEGYFSADGGELVFQSEREADNPFYQIYLMSLESGDTTRVSPGVGKTTCSWIHPDGRRVLFASTHEDAEVRAKQDAELQQRASGQQRRYAWDYDDTFELYTYDRQSKQYARLTNAVGYDAEGSFSPDGKLIAFASNRAEYEKGANQKAGAAASEHEAHASVSEHEAQASVSAEKLKLDPSYFVDIYIMNADGSGLKRLTDVPGYDGGPFFSPDGKRICWRRFSEDGATAEVFTMKLDGSDVRQLTHMGAMSWAPFYHPSGKYLIFTTNKHGFANFELYIVSAEGGALPRTANGSPGAPGSPAQLSAGSGAPVRVTVADKFDGLPVFSPDGKRLAWTCSRTADGQAQIFIGDWDHAKALELLAAARTESRAEAASNGNRVSAAVEIELPPAPQTVADITPADTRAHVEALASEAFEGRLTGTAGERAATAYVAREFERLGLQPAGDDGTYFDNFEFVAGVSLDDGNQLVATTGAAKAESSLHDWRVGEDWRPLAYSATGEFPSAAIVFAGYGIVASKTEDFPAIDSYGDADVSGKWVMVLRYEPADLSPEHRQYLSRFSSLRYKAMIARDKGALGVVFVSGPDAQVKEQLVRLEFDAAAGRTSVAVMSATDEMADQWFRASGTSLARQVAALKQPAAAPHELKDVTLKATIALKNETRRGRNVAARLARGNGTVGEPFVAVGAHVDHLGRGQGTNSLATADEGNQIHYGADDNASGVAAMLEGAEWLVEQKKQGQLDLKRDIVFVAWSGEELGLIGSKHYVDEIGATLTSPNDIRGRVVAYLNMDMVGRLDKSLLLAGVGSSSIWRKEIEKRNAVVGLPIILQEDGYLPTDATSFYLKGVPILSAFSGVHAEYHTPRDTPEKLNYDGAAKIARFMALAARGLATRVDAPDFIAPSKPDPSARRGGRANLRAYMGTIPDYAPADVPGLKLSGVATGGPAHAGGLRGGDIIVEFAGKKVENIYDYTYALEALRVGQAVKAVVLRDGERKEFEVTPGSRE